MTIAQFIVAYAVSWWLVLFMVLPSGATPAPAPEKGHAPSAPEKPRLRKKFRLTTALALLPTLLIYLVATNVKAEEVIHRVGGGCRQLQRYKPSDDLSTRDGYGVGDKKVKSANLNDKSALIATDSVRIPLRIPAQNVIDRTGGAATSPTSINGRNVDFSQSFLAVGDLEVKQDGDVLLNGQSITQPQIYEEGCSDDQ
jgi:predicted secreted protein